MGMRWLRWAILGLIIAATAAPEWWLPVSVEPPASAQPERLIDTQSGGEGCDLLATLEPVPLQAKPRGSAPAWAGLGYSDPRTDRILVPVRRLISLLAPGPLAVTWDESGRTATLLREGAVLSVHFPVERNRSAIAILNGEVELAESVLCEGRLHAPLRLLTDGLGLRAARLPDGSLLIEAR